MLAGLVSSEASLLGLKMTVFSPCPHMVFPLPVSVSYSYKDTSEIGLGPTIGPHLKAPSPNAVTL